MTPVTGVEAFSIDFTGLGENIATVLKSLGPVAFYAAAFVIGMGILGWFVSMVGRGTSRGGKKA